MPNFDLTTLPRCNAKTKQGGQCQRYGTKRNGRCKLHGGRSKGPQTDIGKLISSANSGNIIKRQVDSMMVTKRDLNIAKNVYIKLISFINDHPINWQHLDYFISHNLLKLERYKYVAAYALSDLTATTNIQQALDNYYMHNGNEHLKFHSINAQFQFGPFIRKNHTSSASINKMRLDSCRTRSNAGK